GSTSPPIRAICRNPVTGLPIEPDHSAQHRPSHHEDFRVRLPQHPPECDQAPRGAAGALRLGSQGGQPSLDLRQAFLVSPNLPLPHSPGVLCCRPAWRRARAGRLLSGTSSSEKSSTSLLGSFSRR